MNDECLVNWTSCREFTQCTANEDVYAGEMERHVVEAGVCVCECAFGGMGWGGIN